MEEEKLLLRKETIGISIVIIAFVIQYIIPLFLDISVQTMTIMGILTTIIVISGIVLIALSKGCSYWYGITGLLFLYVPIIIILAVAIIYGIGIKKQDKLSHKIWLSVRSAIVLFTFIAIYAWLWSRYQ